MTIHQIAAGAAEPFPIGQAAAKAIAATAAAAAAAAGAVAAVEPLPLATSSAAVSTASASPAPAAASAEAAVAAAAVAGTAVAGTAVAGTAVAGTAVAAAAVAGAATATAAAAGASSVTPRASVRQRLTSLLTERLATGSRPGQRTDGARMALAIEGGGMRGSVSAGMALAMHELGLLDAFDAVYGASAGAISAAWLVSSRPEGLRGWADQRFASALIRKRNLLRGRPLVDVERLIEQIYMHEFPLDYASILANPVELHPLATDIATGEAADLYRELTDCHALRLAIRASAALPVLAGAPITLGGRRYFDAGLAESVPFRQALRDGATHVLVLRSRPALVGAEADRVSPSLGARFVARVALRRHPRPLRASYLCRAARLVDDDRVLAAYEADGTPLGDSAVLAIRPDPSMPAVSRLETNNSLLKEAFEIGRSAVYAWHEDLAVPASPAAGGRGLAA